MKYFFVFGLAVLLLSACKDDALSEADRVNYFTATIDSSSWVAHDTYSEKARGEGGPLTIVGEGDNFTLELVLGGINEPGEYMMGINRTGRIKMGNTTYTTLDVQDAGQIIITRLSNNRVEGEFSFNAQWLSANHTIRVRDGKFSVFYY